MAVAFCAMALPAAAQVPRAVLDAVQRLPPTRALEAALRAAPCAFAPVARHLDPLPSHLPWDGPDAVVVFDGLPGLPATNRAVVLRPTRELLARAATRDRSRRAASACTARPRAVARHAPTPSFLAFHVAPPATPPEGCVAQGPR